MSHVARLHYAEIVASISSKSAGPVARANIAEFTETTSKAIKVVGGAVKGKAIIILNAAEPPVMIQCHVALPSGETASEASGHLFPARCNRSGAAPPSDVNWAGVVLVRRRTARNGSNH